MVIHCWVGSRVDCQHGYPRWQVWVDCKPIDWSCRGVMRRLDSIVIWLGEHLCPSIGINNWCGAIALACNATNAARAE